MADFTQFEGAEQVTEEDPAAAFLAREQDDLAALEGDEFGSAEPAPNTVTGDGTADFLGGQESFPSEPSAGADDAGLFDPLADNTNTNVADFGASEEPQSSDPYTAIKSVDIQRQEPEKIRIWREEQVECLAKKDAESEQKKGEWREVAKKELEDWYKHRAEQLEKTIQTNKEGETAFISERDETIPGHEWERICRHCDFNPKSSRSSKDISRMRSILLQLKQTGIQRG